LISLQYEEGGGMSKRWTLDEAIRQGHLLAFIAQEAEHGITEENRADVEKALNSLKQYGKAKQLLD
jgi:hypothetical protein